ncbi:MAG TPA: GNAT family N-acetyltransferase [Gemmatimonadaceae bacterium]|nr:GNAT family N-acetyltransferase [Gemmatimonadaceae bacterium]
MNDVLYERSRGALVVSTDRARIDVDLVHRVLGASYWAAGIPREVVERAIAGSVAFGLYDGAEQIGFARVITDLATYAYLSDVFIVETRRGNRLGDWLIESIMRHPQLQGLRRFALFTRDAASLYQRHGFAAASGPSGYMEILDRGVYATPPAT